MATLLLLGLDDASAEAISRLASQAGHSVRRESMRTTFETRPMEDLVVVSGDQGKYRDAIYSLRQFPAAPPVVVISRLGETSGWLDALEAGASDFLAAPYTLPQIRGVMQVVNSRSKTFAA